MELDPTQFIVEAAKDINLLHGYIHYLKDDNIQLLSISNDQNYIGTFGLTCTLFNIDVRLINYDHNPGNIMPSYEFKAGKSAVKPVLYRYGHFSPLCDFRDTDERDRLVIHHIQTLILPALNIYADVSMTDAERDYLTWIVNNNGHQSPVRNTDFSLNSAFQGNFSIGQTSPSTATSTQSAELARTQAHPMVVDQKTSKPDIDHNHSYENVGKQMSNSQKLQVAEDLVKEAANLLTKHIEANADDKAMYRALNNAPKDYSDETKKAAIKLAKSNKVKTIPSGKTFSDQTKAVGFSEADIRENAGQAMSNSQKLQVAEDLVKEAANLLTKHIEANADDKAMYRALNNAPKDYSDETKKAAIKLAKSNKVKTIPNVNTIPSGKTFSDQTKAVGFSEADIRENAGQEMSNSQKLQVAEDLVKEAANLLTKHIEVNADDNAMYIALSNAPKDYSDETKKAAIELAKSNKVKAMPNVKTLPSGKTFSDRAKAVGLSEAGIRENAAELGMDPEDYLRMCEQ